MAKRRTGRSDTLLSTELQAVLEYWRDRAAAFDFDAETNESEAASAWRTVQIQIERFAAGLLTHEELTKTLAPYFDAEPELAELVSKLGDLQSSPRRHERQKAQMTR